MKQKIRFRMRYTQGYWIAPEGYASVAGFRVWMSYAGRDWPIVGRRVE